MLHEPQRPCGMAWLRRFHILPRDLAAGRPRRPTGNSERSPLGTGRSVLWLALMLCWQPALQAAEETTVDDSAAESVALPTTAPPAHSSRLQGLSPERQKAVLRAVEGARRNIWWNKPRIIESLALGQAQRQSMDRHLEVFLVETLTDKDQPMPPNHFRLGLLEGDFDVAREGLEELGDRAKQRSMREGEMMLQVLECLSDEQLLTFRSRHRRLLNRSWVLLVAGQGRSGKGVSRRRPAEGGAGSPGAGG